MNNEIKILVTGVGGPAGRATTKFLKEKGFFVVGVDMRDVETEASIFHKVPPAIDPSYLASLYSLINKFSINLLIPTVTEELVIISSIKNKLKKIKCIVFVPSKKYTSIANDKFLTAQFLRKKGIPTPKTILGNGLYSIKELEDNFNFPMLSKPRFGRGAKGVKVYYSIKDLMEENRNGLVYQEFIPGEEFNGNLFCYPAGNPLVNVILKKIALEYGIVGNAIAVKREINEQIKNITDRTCRALKLEGPIDIDVRLNNDKLPIILEVNARVGANVLHASEVLEKLLEIFLEKMINL